MLAAVWLMLSSLLYSLQLSAGSFPKPLSPKEEAHYLALAAQGDLGARNILIERNLWLVTRTLCGIEKDITKLADILGHSSINTTRIYIMTTGTEHAGELNAWAL